MSRDQRKPIVLSDSLAAYYSIVASFPMIAAALGDPRQVFLTIDTNVILADIVWSARYGAGGACRTSLEEVLVSNTVVGFAPTLLRSEVRRNLADLAAQTGLEVATLEAQWTRLEPLLHYHEPDTAASGPWVDGIQNVKDRPFIVLRAQVGAVAVHTKDRGIAKEGVPIVGKDVVIDLRTYAREMSLVCTVRFGGVATVVLTGEVLVALGRLARAVGRRIADAPPALQLALLGGLAIAIMHRRTRTVLAECLCAAGVALAEYGAVICSFLETLSTELAEAEARAAAAFGRFDAALPTGRRPTARDVAFGVCVAAGRPLTLDELAARMRLAGYQSRSRQFATYLKSVLGQDGRFIETATGAWRHSERQAA